MKNKKVCNKTRSPPSSLLFRGQGTEHTTVKWPISKLRGAKCYTFFLFFSNQMKVECNPAMVTI